ncbi:MAG: RidA family protein [Gammaproteobacteria bacterium]|nr:RidA family protein [Gammaproteobacteria bacterium]
MEILLPEGWSRPPGFSNGTVAEGRHVFIAGQIGREPTPDGRLEAGFAAQTRRALQNVIAILAEAGGGPQHIARLNWYVTDIGRYRTEGRDIGKAYVEVMGKHFPAMTMLEVSALLDPEALVEIEAHAVLD